MRADDGNTTTRGRRHALGAVVLAAAALAGAACGSSTETTATTTTQASATSGSTGTTSGTTPGTTKPKTSGTTPGTSKTNGTMPSGTIVDAANSELEADVEAADVTWNLNAQEFRGEDGMLVAYDCTPDGEASTVWGDVIYTDDSSVCTAAVHAGLIDLADGGRVVIEIQPGLETYETSTANGVTTFEYGSWPGSFVFPGL